MEEKEEEKEVEEEGRSTMQAQAPIWTPPWSESFQKISFQLPKGQDNVLQTMGSLVVGLET